MIITKIEKENKKETENRKPLVALYDMRGIKADTWVVFLWMCFIWSFIDTNTQIGSYFIISLKLHSKVHRCEIIEHSRDKII